MSKSIELIDNPSTPIAEYEKFWAERIADLQPLTIPYAMQTAGQKKGFVELMLPIADELIGLLQESFPGVKQADILFTAFVCYLARISGTVSFDIGFADAELKQIRLPS